MRESEVIREIDPDSEFALFGLDICPLDTVTVSQEDCLEDCDHLVDFVIYLIQLLIFEVL